MSKQEQPHAALGSRRIGELLLAGVCGAQMHACAHLAWCSRSSCVERSCGSFVVVAQVQLDGSVRASGTGMPPWERWVSEIPELDSLQTRLTDGVGT